MLRGVRTFVRAKQQLQSMRMSSNGCPSHVDFGPWCIPTKEQVFFLDEHSMGLVNLKPIVPGHVLVVPRTMAKRFVELSDTEVSELWICAKRIGKLVESHYGATSLTFAIQDGVEAGQTVPHVHIHVLPRCLGDFEPKDKIYDALNEHNATPVENNTAEESSLLKKKSGMDDEERVPRTAEEMQAEAEMLRDEMTKMFPQLRNDVLQLA